MAQGVAFSAEEEAETWSAEEGAEESRKQKAEQKTT
jgi:hypothetical protein